MDNFCWLTGPELCGKLNFDLPVIEIIAMAAVSGLVTWATIYFSLRQARIQTDRAIADARSRELRAAIKELAETSQEAYAREDLTFVQDHRWIAAFSTIATSGVPYADGVTDWVYRYLFASVAIKKNPKIEPPADINFLEIGPAVSIVRDIGLWISDPETFGPQLTAAANTLDQWVEGGGLDTRSQE